MENGIRPPIQMAVDSMRSLRLGNQGEQNAQLIRIDVSKWLEKWPGAGIDLMLALPGEKASYPAKTLLQDGELLFLPGFGDTQKAGHGVAYVVATLNGTHVAVSDTVLTEILPKGRDGDTLPEAPEAQAGWVADVLNAATRAEEAAKRAENAGGGTITDEQIKEAVDEYLTENPIEVPAYDLPTASADTKGGVKVGSGLRMNGDVLGVKPEGEHELIKTITMEEEAVVSVTDLGLHNASIYFTIPATDKTGNISLTMTIGNKKFAHIGYLLAPFSATQESKGRIDVKRTSGGWRVYFPATFIRSAGTTMAIQEVQLYPELRDIQTYDMFNGFTTSAALPKETIIEIRGVRADA